jgi:hypothetical protein
MESTLVVFSSFNFDGPPVVAILLALGIALLFVVLLGFFSRRILVGLFGGAIIAAGISFVIISMGRGDMVDLIVLFCTPIAAACGALVGGIAGYIGKRSVVSTSRDRQGQNEGK